MVPPPGRSATPQARQAIDAPQSGRVLSALISRAQYRSNSLLGLAVRRTRCQGVIEGPQKCQEGLARRDWSEGSKGHFRSFNECR